MTRPSICFAICLFAAGTVEAGPLNKAWVGRGAEWVVHVDVEAGLGSTLGRYIREHHEELGIDDIERIRRETGMDPFGDVKGLTIYGSERNASDGIAILQTTAAVEKLIERIRAKDATFKQVEEGGLTLYTWSEHGRSRFAHVRPGPDGDRLVVVAPERARLLEGIAVVDGKAPALAGREDGVIGRTPKAGSVVFAAANKMPNSEAAPFQNAESFAMDVGEAEGEMFAEVLLVSKTTEDASNLAKVMQGGIALLKMWAANEAQAAELQPLVKMADAVTFASEENRVTAALRCRADTVLESFKGVAEAKSRLKPAGEPSGATKVNGGSESR